MRPQVQIGVDSVVSEIGALAILKGKPIKYMINREELVTSLCNSFKTIGATRLDVEFAIAKGLHVVNQM